MTPLRRVSPLLLLLGLAAASSPADQEPSITISLTPAGVLVVAPATVTVDPGAPLVWSSDLPFAVAFQQNAQLFGRELPPQALRGRQNAPVRAAVGDSAAAGTYKYSVAVWDGENVWVVDPEIIVRRR